MAGKRQDAQERRAAAREKRRADALERESANESTGTSGEGLEVGLDVAGAVRTAASAAATGAAVGVPDEKRAQIRAHNGLPAFRASVGSGQYARPACRDLYHGRDQRDVSVE